MIVCHTVGNWGFYSFINLMPKFMGNYQQYDIKSIGWMTSIPYVLQTVTVLCATWLSDHLRVRTNYFLFIFLNLNLSKHTISER